MSPRILSITVLALAGFIAPAQAHPEVHGRVIIGDGPIRLGVDLGHLAYRHHHSRHVHGPRCYRRYGHRFHGQYGRPHHRPRDWRPQAYREHHRPHHRKPVTHHRHTRDCHLHYPRDHRHWRRGK